MSDRAQDTEAIRAAREADRTAADFATIPFEDHEARKLAVEYLLLKEVNQWLRDDVAVKVETIASLEAERDRLVARLEAAERERDDYRTALDTIDWLLHEDRFNADRQIAARLTRGERIKRDVVELARAALAAAAPGETTPVVNDERPPNSVFEEFREIHRAAPGETEQTP